MSSGKSTLFIVNHTMSLSYKKAKGLFFSFCTAQINALNTYMTNWEQLKKDRFRPATGFTPH